MDITKNITQKYIKMRHHQNNTEIYKDEWTSPTDEQHGHHQKT